MMLGKALKKFAVDCVTGRDNATFDHSRVLGIVSFVVYIGLAVYNTEAGTPWSPTEFSTGISVMAVAFGVNLRLKEPTEPPKQE